MCVCKGDALDLVLIECSLLIKLKPFVKIAGALPFKNLKTKLSINPKYLVHALQLIIPPVHCTRIEFNLSHFLFDVKRIDSVFP